MNAIGSWNTSCTHRKRVSPEKKNEMLIWNNHFKNLNNYNFVWLIYKTFQRNDRTEHKAARKIQQSQETDVRKCSFALKFEDSRFIFKGGIVLLILNILLLIGFLSRRNNIKKRRKKVVSAKRIIRSWRDTSQVSKWNWI